MARILIAWLGDTDIKFAEKWQTEGRQHVPLTPETKGTYGPLRTLTDAQSFDELVLLHTTSYDLEKKNLRAQQALLVADFVKVGSRNQKIRVKPWPTSITDPTDHNEVYDALEEALPKIKKHFPKDQLVFHLTPGTPATHAVMLVVGKQWFAAEILRTVDKRHADAQGNQIFTVQFPLGLLSIDVAKKVDGPGLFTPALEPKEQSLLLGRIAQEHKVNILLLGETGVGKTYIAKAIHTSSGRKGHYIPINCAGLTESIVESELFGHAKGAFTGANIDKDGVFKQAHKGTLFLDEVGELSLHTQAKLLRVIEEGKVRPVGDDKEISVDVRLVCATNVNLMEAVAKGTFRADLYYRIAHYEVRLRPFRDYTSENKKEMTTRLLQGVAHDLDSSRKPYQMEAGEKAMGLLCEYSWPGNIRQLRHALLRLCVLTDGNTVRAEAVRQYLETLGNAAPVATGGATAKALCTRYVEQAMAEGISLTTFHRNVKQQALDMAMEKSRHRKTAAAKLLKIPLQRLDYALKHMEEE